MATKNQKLKAALITLLIMTAVMAYPDTAPRKDASEANRTIREFIKFPGVLIHQSHNKELAVEKVEVLFTLDKSGKVNFVLARTKNVKLKQEIEKQFQSLVLRNLKDDVVHSVLLNFRLI
jgi:hypothetical protein